MAKNKIIQSILSQHYEQYLCVHKQPIAVINAIKSQIRCQTKEQGISCYRCQEDQEIREVYHSCRNKGCTVCSEKRKLQWIEKQKSRLLNTEHFHLVFTLPQEYRVLWQYNREWFIKAQFETSHETLKHLLQGNKYKGKTYKGSLNAQVGIISVLHTWGRSLNLHPHIHMLVTAGGLDKEMCWQESGDYLLPVKQVKALYRSKFQSKIKGLLNSDKCKIPPNQSKEAFMRSHQALYKKEWSVRIQEKYAHGKGVLIYLSRYLGNSPVKPEQIQVINRGKEVLFSYYSHKKKKLQQERLSIYKFIKKYSLHQSRTSVHTVRYYGLYASQSKEKHAASVEVLGKTSYQEEQETGKSLLKSTQEVICSCCQGVMLLSYVLYNSWKLKNPLYKREQGIIFPNLPSVALKPSG